MLCVIVDDEVTALNYLKKNVLQIPQLKLIETFKNSVVAKEYLLEHPEIYLVFSDINMSGLSGLELAKLVPRKKVVFTTGYEEYARESWRHINVLGYLSKPISLKDISDIVEKIYPVYIAEKIAQSQKSSTHFIYRLDDKTIEIPFDKILFIESFRNFSKFYTDNETFLAPVPLIEIQRILPSNNFARVSKSAIANRDKIIGLSSDNKYLKLIGGSKCKCSKMYIQSLDLSLI